MEEDGDVGSRVTSPRPLVHTSEFMLTSLHHASELKLKTEGERGGTERRGEGVNVCLTEGGSQDGGGK